MSRQINALAVAGLLSVWCGVSAGAETLRCQSVNGNLNCAGSSGVSCQTIDGRKTCVSGHGDVVQSFGGGAAPDISADDADGADEPDVPRARHGGLPPQRDAGGLSRESD
nr:hypothetical protein [uncultured Rhodopila sp.]